METSTRKGSSESVCKPFALETKGTPEARNKPEIKGDYHQHLQQTIRRHRTKKKHVIRHFSQNMHSLEPEILRHTSRSSFGGIIIVLCKEQKITDL